MTISLPLSGKDAVVSLPQKFSTDHITHAKSVLETVTTGAKALRRQKTLASQRQRDAAPISVWGQSSGLQSQASSRTTGGSC